MVRYPGEEGESIGSGFGFGFSIDAEHVQRFQHSQSYAEKFKPLENDHKRASCCL